MREHCRQRHVLGRLVRRVTEHHALIARADRIRRVHLAFAGLDRLVDALRDVGRLLVERDENAAGVGVEPVARVRIADLAHRLTDDLRNVHITRRRNLPNHMRLPRRHERLTGNASLRILRENRIEDAVGNLIGEFIGMPLGHGLGCKQHFFHTKTSPGCRKIFYQKDILIPTRKASLSDGRLMTALIS